MKDLSQVRPVEDFMKLAEAKAEQSDYVGAVQNYNQAILVDPDYARAYGNRAFVRVNLGDRQGAIADFHKAATLFLAQGSTANYEMVMCYIREVEQN
ncbi:MAG: tetratricopeptide repeat protein [Pseudanabaenales cyanobacterium]|nr:tetratricopeptide repeat protein [Pseudanabaenales cyanobacterium]